MRWVSKSKLRPKCADGGGGDAGLRDSGQHVDKGDSLCMTLESHDRTSCTPPGSQHVERREHELKNDAHQQMVQANQLQRFPFGCDWQMAGSQKEP